MNNSNIVWKKQGYLSDKNGEVFSLGVEIRRFPRRSDAGNDDLPVTLIGLMTPLTHAELKSLTLSFAV